MIKFYDKDKDLLEKALETYKIELNSADKDTNTLNAAVDEIREGYLTRLPIEIINALKYAYKTTNNIDLIAYYNALIAYLQLATQNEVQKEVKLSEYYLSSKI